MYFFLFSLHFSFNFLYFFLPVTLLLSSSFLSILILLSFTIPPYIFLFLSSFSFLSFFYKRVHPLFHFAPFLFQKITNISIFSTDISFSFRLLIPFARKSTWIWQSIFISTWVRKSTLIIYASVSGNKYPCCNGFYERPRFTIAFFVTFKNRTKFLQRNTKESTWVYYEILHMNKLRLLTLSSYGCLRGR